MCQLEFGLKIWGVWVSLDAPQRVQNPLLKEVGKPLKRLDDFSGTFRQMLKHPAANIPFGHKRTKGAGLTRVGHVADNRIVQPFITRDEPCPTLIPIKPYLSVTGVIPASI
jgi:hypothetical protein